MPLGKEMHHPIHTEHALNTHTHRPTKLVLKGSAHSSLSFSYFLLPITLCSLLIAFVIIPHPGQYTSSDTEHYIAHHIIVYPIPSYLYLL